jgi:hypothetical protein
LDPLPLRLALLAGFGGGDGVVVGALGLIEAEIAVVADGATAEGLAEAQPARSTHVKTTTARFTPPLWVVRRGPFDRGRFTRRLAEPISSAQTLARHP